MAKIGPGANDFYDHDLNIVNQMFYCNTVRGAHGSGMFYVTHQGKAYTCKSAGAPYILAARKEFPGYWADIKKHNSRIVVTHNRFATKGDKTDKNAHPFLCGNIVMVHNGAVEHGSDLKNLNKFDVDSEALCSSINEIGIHESIKKTQGAYAIVYYNVKERTLNMIRNKERPLHIALDKQINTITFASEAKMLDWILTRNTRMASSVQMLELPTDELWTFSMDKWEPKKEPLMGKVKTYSTGGGSSSSTVRDFFQHNGVMVPDRCRQTEPTRAEVIALPPPKAKHVDPQWKNSSEEDKWERWAELHGMDVLPSQTDNVIKLFLENERKKQQAAAPKPASAPQTLFQATVEHRKKNKVERNPKLKEVCPNTKNYDKLTQYLANDGTRVNETPYVIRVEDRISVTVHDHVQENKEGSGKHYIIGHNDEIPNARIQFCVDNDIQVETIFNACLVNVKVRSILQPDISKTTDQEIIIWASDPRFTSEESAA